MEEITLSWKWQQVLQPLPVTMTEDSLINDVIIKLNKHNTNICFIQNKVNTIIGYVTTDSLLTQLALVNNTTEKIEPLTNFLFVHEQSTAKFIHNCSLVIGANNEHEPTGYLFMDQLENKLNELKFNNINGALNSAEIGIVVLNKSFQIQFMNEQAEQILGMDLSVLQNRDYRSLIKTEQSLDNVLHGQTAFGIESTFNTKVMTGQFSPVYEEENVVGIIHNFYLKEQFANAVHDIQFVKEMHNYLQAFYEHSNEQVLIIRADLIIEEVTGSFFEQFWQGVDRQQLQGTHLSVLSEKNIPFEKLVTKCINEKTKVTLKQRRNGTTLLSTATPILENDTVKKVFILSKNISITDNDSDEIHQRELDDKEVIYQSSKMNDLLQEVEAVSPFNSTVLITGESGVGKEVIARRIHSLSKRNQAPFLAVNCGALPENIIESELFGHEKGAFTGAIEDRIGLFEQAHNGTVFLDEIGELPYLMQVRLLRVLQEREITRVGSSTPINVNVRIIAATNKNLQKLVQQKTFREDLFYRLHVIPLVVPPLRKRKEDIAPLSIHFLNEFNQFLTEKKTIAPKAISMLENYTWPGNVRELENMIERLIITTKTSEITEQDVNNILWKPDGTNEQQLIINNIMPLKEAVIQTEKQLIELAMNTYDTATEAAEALNVSVSTVSRRMKKYRQSGGQL